MEGGVKKIAGVERKMSKDITLPKGMWYWVDGEGNIHIESDRDIYEQDERSLLKNTWRKK